jgi:hypothetical protein
MQKNQIWKDRWRLTNSPVQHNLTSDPSIVHGTAGLRYHHSKSKDSAFFFLMIPYFVWLAGHGDNEEEEQLKRGRLGRLRRGDTSPEVDARLLSPEGLPRFP